MSSKHPKTLRNAAKLPNHLYHIRQLLCSTTKGRHLYRRLATSAFRYSGISSTSRIHLLLSMTSCHIQAHVQHSTIQKKYSFKKDSLSPVCQTKSPTPISESFAFPAATINSTGTAASLAVDSWILDSGCTDHICCNKDLLSDLHEGPAVSVRIANGTSYISSTYGSAIIGNMCLHKVLYFPKFHGNLISVSKLADSGYGIAFGLKRATIFSPGCKTPKLAIPRNGNLWSIPGTIPKRSAAAASKVDNETWHRRLGHCNIPAIKYMAAENIVNGLSTVESKQTKQNSLICEPCIMGKMAKLKYSQISHSPASTAPLQLIHSDICVLNKSTYNGFHYFITFIDDYSGYAMVQLLKRKCDAITAFKDYRALAENQVGGRIKKLQTDGGGEFCSNEFKKLLADCGILHRITMPYAHEQNGKAERFNRTVINMARSMIYEYKAPTKYWGEAVSYATHILNRIVSSPGRKPKQTPFELWTGTKPTLEYIRPFGCPAFAQIPKEKRTKLDQLAIKCNLIGITPLGYKLVDTTNGKIFISRNVQFDETKQTPNVPLITQDWEPYPKVSTAPQVPSGMPIPTAIQQFNEFSAEISDDDELTLKNLPLPQTPASSSYSPASTEVLPNRVASNFNPFLVPENAAEQPQLPLTPSDDFELSRIPISHSDSQDNSFASNSDSSYTHDLPELRAITPEQQNILETLQTPPAPRRSTRQRAPPKEYWRVEKLTSNASTHSEDSIYENSVSDDETPLGMVSPAQTRATKQKQLEIQRSLSHAKQSYQNSQNKSNALTVSATDDPVEPVSYNEAINGPDANTWLSSIAEELESMRVNNVYTLMPLPAGRAAIKSKWVFRIKRNFDNVVILAAVLAELE